MSTVFQATSLPLGGSVNVLGPVTMIARYPAKQTSTGKMMRTVIAKDNSGEIKLSLFGPAAELPIVDGGTYTFKGSMKRGEYPKDSGNAQLSAEGLQIDGVAPAPATASHVAPQSHAPANSFEEKVTHLELAEQMATFTLEFEQQLVHKGLGKEVIEKLVARAPEFAAQWWFGAKSLKMANDGSGQEPY